jgi:hypothetical protein
MFPEEMLNSSSGSLTMETIAGKLTYFHEQLHLIHWQTSSYAEHQAIGSLYEYVQTFKDDVIEKLMGYTGKKPKAFKIDPLKETDCVTIVNELGKFAHQLYKWSGENEFCDIENMAQELSGQSAKTKYLLTLS